METIIRPSLPIPPSRFSNILSYDDIEDSISYLPGFVSTRRWSQSLYDITKYTYSNITPQLNDYVKCTRLPPFGPLSIGRLYKIVAIDAKTEDNILIQLNVSNIFFPYHYFKNIGQTKWAL